MELGRRRPLGALLPAFLRLSRRAHAKYWSAIYDVRANTVCTEHEYYIAQAIYTPEVLALIELQFPEEFLEQSVTTRFFVGMRFRITRQNCGIHEYDRRVLLRSRG